MQYALDHPGVIETDVLGRQTVVEQPPNLPLDQPCLLPVQVALAAEQGPSGTFVVLRSTESTSQAACISDHRRP
jgi:hypothetical protein